MKIKTAIIALSVSIATSAVMAEKVATDEIVLRGVLDMGDVQTFSLTSPGGQSSNWVKVGDQFNGFEVLKYNEDTKLLTVSKDGQEFLVSLAGITQSDADLTQDEARAEAYDMIMKTRFKETIAKMMDAQEEAMAEAIAHQMAQQGVDDPEFLAFQKQAITEMFDDINWGAMETKMIDIYANVFTPDELRGMNEFYSTPAGIASIDKSPELQKEMMTIMMPEMMQASMKMQGKIENYVKERRAAEAQANQASE
ncbi:MAG: DUF2059 domain-containing protein [Verrucomicrobiota bacterium]